GACSPGATSPAATPIGWSACCAGRSRSTACPLLSPTTRSRSSTATRTMTTEVRAPPRAATPAGEAAPPLNALTLVRASNAYNDQYGIRRVALRILVPSAVVAVYWHAWLNTDWSIGALVTGYHGIIDILRRSVPPAGDVIGDSIRAAIV